VDYDYEDDWITDAIDDERAKRDRSFAMKYNTDKRRIDYQDWKADSMYDERTQSLRDKRHGAKWFVNTNDEQVQTDLWNMDTLERIKNPEFFENGRLPETSEELSKASKKYDKNNAWRTDADKGPLIPRK